MFKSTLFVALSFIISVSAAGIFPIEENPVPAWANSATDVCKVISTCDRCPSTSARYCFYKDSGDANCCVGKGADSKPSKASAPLVASIVPIEEDIPKWASAADQCAVVNTCDRCSVTEGQSYCYYKESGEATCCNKASTGDKKPSSGLLVASVVPIEEDPVPQWASASDVCATTRSCDLCQPSASQYCHYLESGEAKCCNKASSNPEPESTSQEVPASGLFVAGVGPIEEDPVPKWASDADACASINTCDRCAISEGQSYCFYKNSGEATCCQRASAASSTSQAAETPADDSGVMTAAVVPIEENPIPAWASALDICLQIKSCDYCSGGDQTYCKYSDQGEASCCKRP